MIFALQRYAVAQEIDHEAAFDWWVPHVLKKHKHIISSVKQRQVRCHKRTHKFGIKLPTSVKDTYALDKKNGNTFWADAILKDVKNVKVAFDILPDKINFKLIILEGSTLNGRYFGA